METDPRLRWLKPLVIGLSALLVILMLALIVGFITGAPGRRAETATARPGQPQSLSLPKDARILEIVPAGDAVILRLRLADGSEQLHSLNARSLAPQASLLLQPDR